MSEPFCPRLRQLFIQTANELKLKHHPAGTMITIEGPRFSTKTESLMFRQWGGDVINMSTVPEVILAREANICYQTIAMATDYDCWKEGEEPVAWDIITERMAKNYDKIKKLLINIIPKINYYKCDCR